MAETLARSERQALKAHIKSLEEEVAFLRGLLAPAQVQGINGGPMEANRLWTSEDEEDAQELLDEGLIDKDEYRRMLDAAGAMNTEVDFHPTP